VLPKTDVNQHKSQFASQTMNQEKEEGSSHPAAWKGTEAAAPAPALETTPKTTAEFSGAFSAQNEYHGVEKRRTPRYKCEGRVELYEAGCDVHTSAALTDLSLHGCYVETQATYPVGTTLAMKLNTNGRKFELSGVVRVHYPSLGMGIAFVEMTESTRSELKDLFTSISRSMMVNPAGTSLSSREPMESVPRISDPTAAVQALLTFFKDRQMIVREDFMRVLRQSQDAGKP
jgi:hypothetical protein